jgi:molybdopterin molybdotransferase
VLAREKPVKRGFDPEEEMPLLPIAAHLERIMTSVQRLTPQRLAIVDALGCVVAQDVIAPRDLPPFASSAMDGYAVRSTDVATASADEPAWLRVVGEVPMGEPTSAAVGADEAIAVSTGGVVPSGADAVVPVELTRPDEDHVAVLRALPVGKHVRPAGEDVRRGDTIVAAGRRLGPPDIGALAACGFADVLAVPRARVGVVSTGDELVRPPATLQDGQIYDSNAFVLAACIREAGAEPVDAGPVKDDPQRLIETLDRLASDVDAFVCSGGVSMGPRDPVKRAFEQRFGWERVGSHGGEIGFANVAMQPGRPQAFGHLRGKPFFGLPGNPISVYVSFEVFVRPALTQMMGRTDARPTVRATLDGELDAPKSRTRFARVRVRREGDEHIATPEGGHQSNLLATFARADGLVEIPAGTTIAHGQRCTVMLIRDLA